MNSQEYEAFAELGLALNESGWEPKKLIAHPFGDSQDNRIYLVRVAVSFLQENDEKIRKVLCEDGACRIEIPTGTTVVTTVADVLLQVVGFPYPVNAVANCIAIYGLTKYCAGGQIEPRPQKTP